MNTRPCYHCKKFLINHLQVGESGLTDLNKENWCIREDDPDIRLYYMYYKPMDNLTYLEWRYGQRLSITT